MLIEYIYSNYHAALLEGVAAGLWRVITEYSIMVLLCILKEKKLWFHSYVGVVCGCGTQQQHSSNTAQQQHSEK